MDDKFILMGLNDEKSRKVAQILKSETSKKILDFLGDVKEASETDISKELKVPLNTVEYNLKKLVDAGLVKKTNTFFWSRKGKKIPMYAITKKHIIISPDGSRPSSKALRAILPVLGILAIGLLTALIVFQTTETKFIPSDDLQKFSSYDELKNFLESNTELAENKYYAERSSILKTESSGIVTTQTQDYAQDFSTTNIQVEGVDEPDFVKNDKKYIYVVSGTKISIVDAYPAENMSKISEIEMEDYTSEMFINGNKLIAFGNRFIKIYDISDKSKPVLNKEINTDGYYVDSRMIGNYIYIINNKHLESSSPKLPVLEVDGVEIATKATDIFYFPYPDLNYIFSSIIALNIETGDFKTETYLTGYSTNIFVSQDNVYLTYTKYINNADKLEKMVENVFIPLMPDFEDDFNNVLDSYNSYWEKETKIYNIVEDYSGSLIGDEKTDFDAELFDSLQDFLLEITKDFEKTIIHKINIDMTDINYKSKGEVPGRILNQFSMDEYDNYFRIATTTGNTWENTSLNHLYVLNEDLEIIGKVEDLAQGEIIYSARFIRDKAYIVTFRQIDPFYVIDLINPEEPKVLGYLKIPGYSSYLHPFEDKIIGIGAEDNHIKISLFNVSDFENPVEIGKYVVEDFSTSEILYEHKAFLFDESSGLMVIPIESCNYSDDFRTTKKWYGAYVFEISDSVDLKRKIMHSNEDYDYQANVRRSLFMDEYLYTISGKKIKVNDLNTIEEINQIELPYKDYNRIIAY